MYGKMFSSTFSGSMFGAGSDVFAVWGYVIANTVNSTVELNPQMLAAIIGSTPDRVEKAIEYLCAPDPLSRNSEKEGRRLIKQGSFQYFVVTYEFYRNIRNEDERRQYNRLKMRENRERKVGITQGYVYYARTPIGVKIGFSLNPWSRINEMKTVSPNIELVAVEKGPKILEQDRHKQFSSDRIAREWFKPSDVLLKHIESISKNTVSTTTDSTTYTTSMTTDTTLTTCAHTEADVEEEKINTLSLFGEQGKPKLGAKDEVIGKVWEYYRQQFDRRTDYSFSETRKNHAEKAWKSLMKKCRELGIPQDEQPSAILDWWCAAIEFMKADKFHNGQNEQHVKYNDWENLFSGSKWHSPDKLTDHWLNGYKFPNRGEKL